MMQTQNDGIELPPVGSSTNENSRRKHDISDFLRLQHFFLDRYSGSAKMAEVNWRYGEDEETVL
jgi:hypothetical protein